MAGPSNFEVDEAAARQCLANPTAQGTLDYLPGERANDPRSPQEIGDDFVSAAANARHMPIPGTRSHDTVWVLEQSDDSAVVVINVGSGPAVRGLLRLARDEFGWRQDEILTCWTRGRGPGQASDSAAERIVD